VASITKYRCDHCAKEVEDPYLENGWLRFQGHITRMWGTRKHGTQGDGKTDYIGGNSEFCSVRCLVAALDKLRTEHKGPPVDPKPKPVTVVESDPFKLSPEDAPKKPWEDPLPDDDVSDAVRAYESSIGDMESNNS
jgi:hypothetical protein